MNILYIADLPNQRDGEVYCYLQVLFVVWVGSCRPESSIELEREVKNLRLAIGDMHIKHRSLAKEMQFHRDTDAKNKSELRQLKSNISFPLYYAYCLFISVYLITT